MLSAPNCSLLVAKERVMNPSFYYFVLMVVWLALGALFYIFSIRMPLRALIGRDVPIQKAYLYAEDESFLILTLSGRYYGRKIDRINVQQRLDGQAHTSAKLSLMGVTILVPLEEDVQSWWDSIKKAKTEHAAYLESLKPQRVLPH